MKYLKVLTRKEIEVDGEKKHLWFKCGYLKVSENDTGYLTLFNQPETEFFIFKEDEERLPDIQLQR